MADKLDALPHSEDNEGRINRDGVAGETPSRRIYSRPAYSVLGVIIILLASSSGAIRSLLGMFQRSVLSASPALAEFGSVREGELVNRTFHIINDSDRWAHIERVTTSCGCTTVSTLRDIAPKGSRDLHVTFNSDGHTGEASKIIMVAYSVGRVDKMLTLRLHGVVQPNIVFAPVNDVDFGTLLPEQHVQRVLLFHTADGKSFRYAGLTVDCGQFRRIVANVSILSGTSGKLVATADAPRIAGMYTGKFILNFADVRPPMSVPAQMIVQSAYTFYPSVVSFGAVRPNSFMTKTVELSGPMLSGLQVIHKPAGVRVKLSVGHNKALLLITYQAVGEANSMLDDYVVLQTADEHERQLHLPVYAVVSSTY